MASIAESSVGSLPPAKIEELRQHFLQERATPQANVDRDAEAMAPVVHDTNDTHKTDAEAEIAESANAYRTPISSPKTDSLKVPRLESAKSAPPPEMEAMLNPSPSQDAFNHMTRANSFHVFEGGDTQPNESQVYREYQESVRMSKTTDATTPRKEKVLLQVSPDGKVEYTYDTNAAAETPRTLQEGDTGYLDLANAWEPSPPAGSPSGMEDVYREASPEASLPEEVVFRKPAMPETPSLAGHKRRRSGEMLTSEPSAKRALAFSQFFGFQANKGDTMSGTQLFEQTQAPSSPLPDAPRSDPIITRPSPNIQTNAAPSSPLMQMSSPTHSRAPPATMGEPRENYTSWIESQERERARFEKGFDLRRTSGGISGDIEEDYFDDSMEDQHPRRGPHQTLQRSRSEQTLQLGRARASPGIGSRPATSSSPRKAAMIDLRTPATTKKQDDWSEIDVSDDGEGSDEEPIVEDEPIVEGPADDCETGHEPLDDDQHSEVDVYDEFGQTVLRSQGPGPEDDEDIDGVPQDEMLDDDGPEPETINTAEEAEDDAEQAVPQRTLVQGSSQQGQVDLQKRSQNATQLSAIADSQPLRNEMRPSASQGGNGRSPSCSYVPGSQYAGRTSQDQAQLPVKPIMSTMGPPALSASKSQDGPQAVPSSPPLVATATTAPDNTVEASLERRKMLARFQTDEQGVEQQPEQEIPESDLYATDHGSSRPATAEDRPNTESNNAPFSTARSHLSASGPSPSKALPPPSPLKTFASQHSKVSSQSPRAKAGVRRFADIVGEPSSPKASGETEIDVDAIMGGFIDAEDQEFLEATSSPPRARPQKRCKTVQRPSVRAAFPLEETRVVAQQPPVAEMAPVDVAELQDRPETVRQDDVDDLNARALQNSPSKANEQRQPSPPPESTPESVKFREQAGASAASRLLSKRSSKVTKPTKLSGTGRKAGSKLQHETSVTTEASAPKTKSKKRLTVKAAETEIVSVIETEHSAQATNEPEIEETMLEIHDEGTTGGDDEMLERARDIVAPHRIFALFRGAYNMYSPATWLGASASGHQVKFDDGTTTSIESHFVGRLELALGDQVKVYHEGMRNKTWIVNGFGPVVSSAKAEQTLTDAYGHETVKVQAKSTRNSVHGPNAVPQGEGEVVNVAIEVVYLTQSMWKHVSHRTFQPGASSAAAARYATPSTGVQAPVDAETPTSRSRRTAGSTARALEKRGSFLRDESAAAARTPTVGIFHGMAFAVSYGQNEKEKVEVTRLIQRNGGIILDDGFEGLFDAPKLDDTEITSPTKSARKAPVTANTQAGLQLKPEHKNLGFVALIADRHSRRAKYIQALALGLPTLSGRWVMDCLDTSKNGSLSGRNAAPLPWSKYMLAAGESSYLNGAIRSRDVAAYDASRAKLDDTIANRALLLNGDGVLIVASKKSKAVWERRKAFAFLTLALGAGNMKRVSDTQEAKALTSQDPEKWKFIYVDGSVADASAAVFGKGDKKRKREEPAAMKVDAKAMSATDGKVRIVNDEFVVQSLILGALVD